MSYKYKIEYASSSNPITTIDAGDTGTCYWKDNSEVYIDYYPQPSSPPFVKIEGDLEVSGKIKIGKKLPKGVEEMYLYEVWMVYAEDRKKPNVQMKQVIARDEEDAKVKSGLMKEIYPEWDADFLSFIVKQIGEIKVKEKPQEVKQV